MGSKGLDWLKQRPILGIAGSVALHLLLVGALLWVKPPLSDSKVKRGEPLFVELPQAEEEAQRGLPGGPAVVARPARPAPTEGGLREKPVAPQRPASPERPALPRAPEPPRVASALPEPKPEASAPAPKPAATASEKPAVAEEPKPAAPPKEVPHETAGASPEPRVAAVPGPRESAPAPDIRSALGRGGAGGAGGRGEGRGGIEGEPIPLDSKDPKYNDYLDRVRRRIKAKWVYPCVKDGATGHCEYKSAQLTIEFGILKDGKVPFVTLRSQSGFEVMDEFALNAVKLASPFDPVPESMLSGKKGIPILATFSYIVESSLTNLLR